MRSNIEKHPIKENVNFNSIEDLDESQNVLKDIGMIIKELTNISKILLKLYQDKLYKEVINRFKPGNELISKTMLKIRWIKNLPQEITDFVTITIEIFSIISLAYIKLEDYESSVEFDKKIIYLEPRFHCSYARLFKSYLLLNKKEFAVYYGDILIKNFDEETKKKYRDIIPKIETEKKLLEENDRTYKIQRKRNLRKKFLKNWFPLFIIILSYIYMIYTKKN